MKINTAKYVKKKSLLNTALTAKSGRRVNPIPPQAELFTHTTVNSKKLATSKRRGGGGPPTPRADFD